MIRIPVCAFVNQIEFRMAENASVPICCVFSFFQDFSVMDKQCTKGILTFLARLDRQFIAAFRVFLVIHILLRPYISGFFDVYIPYSSLTGLFISKITAAAANPNAQKNSRTDEPKD